MTKKEKITPEKKLADSKAAGKHANKAQKKNKLVANAKKAVDNSKIVEMAAALPGAGQAKFLVQKTLMLDKLEEQRQAINLAIRGVRADLKGNKISLREYDHVRKLRKMEPEDAKSFKATTALYEDQLNMPLSGEQKAIVENISKQRDDARKVMLDSAGGDTGKEVGSDADKPEDENTDEEKAKKIPEKNMALSNVFTAPVSNTPH